MAITKKYTEQIVVMTTPDQAAQTRGIADEFGVSVAQAARDAMALGLPALREQYRKMGIVRVVPSTRLDGPRDSKSRTRRGRPARVPAAVFSAPTARSQTE